MNRAVALFSGGLDSILAVRILQRQGFQIEALNIRTVFECCQARAAAAALDLGARLTVLPVADDYLDLLRKPRYGYGKGINPCIDCRIYMAKMAKQFMDQVGACVVITGELLGQRPMSQRRWHLDAIEEMSGLTGRLLRPLSARLLPPTIPEQEGLIDRDKLFDFNGRGRRPLIELAESLEIATTPQPSTGCPLTEVTFAPRVRDLIEHCPGASRWDFELLNVGRHLRVDRNTKIILGRNAQENAVLSSRFREPHVSNAALLHPENFLGPDAMLLGQVTDKRIAQAGAVMLRYTRQFDPSNAQVQVSHSDSTRLVRIREDPAVVFPLI